MLKIQLNCVVLIIIVLMLFFFFQAEDGIRDLVRSRGLGDVYKRQTMSRIGKKPVTVPGGVTASVEGQTVKVKGPKGQLLSLIHI